MVAQDAYDEQYGEWNENWWSEEARAKGQLMNQNECGNLSYVGVAWVTDFFGQMRKATETPAVAATEAGE